MTGPFPDLSAFTDVKAERMTLENMQKANVAAFPIGSALPPDQQMAFDRACEAGYIAFVNIRNVTVQTPKGPAVAPCAAYMLSAAGRGRLAELRERERLAKAVQ